jgi:hypothetical protein
MALKRVSVVLSTIDWLRVSIAAATHFPKLGAERAGGILLKKGLDTMNIPYPTPETNDE